MWPREQGQSLNNSPSTQAGLMGKAVGGETGPLVIPSRPQPCRPAGRRWACSGPQPGPRFSSSTAGPLGNEASSLVSLGWPRPPPPTLSKAGHDLWAQPQYRTRAERHPLDGEANEAFERGRGLPKVIRGRASAPVLSPRPRPSAHSRPLQTRRCT